MPSSITSTTDFDDAMQQLLVLPRPKRYEDRVKVKDMICTLVESCMAAVPDNTNDVRWQRLVLLLLHKRYHFLAPEAKMLAATAASPAEDDGTQKMGKNRMTAGEGERCTFYLAAQTLLELATSTNQDGSDTITKSAANDLSRQNAAKAIHVLFQLSPHVGGSRDVCALIELSVGHILNDNPSGDGAMDVSTEGLKLLKGSSTSLLVAEAVGQVEDRLRQSKGCESIGNLLTYAAQTLDEDIALIRGEQEREKQVPTKQATNDERPPLPSTLHVFIPHNKRGKVSKSMKARGKEVSLSFRQLVNTTSEILIWSRTKVAMENMAFQSVHETFLGLRSNCLQGDATEKKAIAKSSLMTMQTVVRKVRQELNSYARGKGFMLTDQFVASPSDIEMRQILRGKSGDLAKLTQYASKKGSTEVLRMIAARNENNPAKITKYSSMRELVQRWTQVASSRSAKDVDETSRFVESIEVARLQATLKFFREATPAMDRQLVVASMDNSILNHVTAACIAAAASTFPVERQDTEMKTEDDEGGATRNTSVQLLLGNSKHTICSLDNFLSLLDGLVSGDLKIQLDAETFADGEGDAGTATTKALLNILERHVAGNEIDLLLLTSADVSIPAQVQKELSSRSCRIHCHDADDIGRRLHREQAKSGDITISLAWDTYDDLDLHVILPTGEEISYSNKAAAKGGHAYLDVDMNATANDSEEPVENVLLGDLEKRIEAAHGTYRVFVQNFGYHTRDRRAAIEWRVVVAMNGTKHRYTGSCVGQGDASNAEACEFTYSGRTVPFPGDDKKDSFAASNLVNVTASAGQTLESVTQLLQTLQQLELLDQARVLVNDSDDNDSGDDMERRTIAADGVLDVTSRDRLSILLARLPKRFHTITAQAFGGGHTLVEICALELSRRMVAEKLPLSALKTAGYPEDIVDAVKEKFASAVAMDVA